MADTIYTKDGKCHVLLGSTTPVSIIRDYCGDEVADWASKLLAKSKQTAELISRIQDLEAELEEANTDLSNANEEIEYLNDKIEELKGDKEL